MESGILYSGFFSVVLTIPFVFFLYCTVLQPFVCEMHHLKIYIHWRFFSACWFNWMKSRLIVKYTERERENSYTGKSTINIFLGSLTQPCNTSPRVAERIIQSFYEMSKKCLQFHPKLLWLFFFKCKENIP